MPSPSRRRALQAAGGLLLAGLAGCNGSDSASRSVPPDTRDRIDDVTVFKVRNRTPTPMVRKASDETTDSRTTEPPRRRANLLLHVTGLDRDTDRAPVFQRDVPGAERLAAFVEATDFGTASVHLTQSAIRECYDRHLVDVYRDSDSVDARFCRTLRPADATCGIERYDVVAFAIRLPFPGEGFSGVGSGGSSSCRRPDRRTIEPDVEHTVGHDGESDE